MKLSRTVMLLERLFGVPDQRLRPQMLDRVDYRTDEISLTLENVRVYADPAAPGTLLQDPRAIDELWRDIDRAPWEGRALLADVIRPCEEFDWHFKPTEESTVKFRFRIEADLSRAQCRKLLRRSMRQAFIEHGVRLRRIVASAPYRDFGAAQPSP